MTKCRRHCCLLFFVLVFGLLRMYVSVWLHRVRWGFVSLVLVLLAFLVVLALYYVLCVLCDTFCPCSPFSLFYSYVIFKRGYRPVAGWRCSRCYHFDRCKPAPSSHVGCLWGVLMLSLGILLPLRQQCVARTMAIPILERSQQNILE